MLLLGKILYIEKKNFNIACQYLDIMDEYLLFEYLLFNITLRKFNLHLQYYKIAHLHVIKEGMMFSD